METYGIDQQDGKGNAAWTRDPLLRCSTNPTAGTPHAVAYCAAFIPGNSAKARSLGYHVESCITIGAMGGGGTKPAVCQRLAKGAHHE